MTTTCQKYFQEIISLKPDFDRKLLEKAINFACLAHDGQLRKSGEPYVSHVLETGKVLAEWNLDEKSIVAGILHDAIDDGAATAGDINKIFGAEIAFLVQGVSRLGTIHLRGSEEAAFVESLRKMFVAMAKDLRVVLIKIADRLHNMRTIEFVAPEKQARIARETIEVLAALADRLQMGRAKGELEDLAFQVLQPEEYAWTKKISAKQFQKIEEEMERVRRSLVKGLRKQEIVGFEIESRKKHLFSLYKKLLRPEVDRQIDRVADLIAFRVLLPTVSDCYLVQGVVGNLYPLIEGMGTTDFIAQPKSNGYQSIHMKVKGPSGRPVEIQIRTFEMHKQAELGVAAHFHYAEAKAKGVSGEKLEKGITPVSKHSLLWVQQLVAWHKEAGSDKEFYEGLTRDFLSDRIFVLTPKGDVIELPNGATPIDFAYAVHTKVGNRAIGARIDGKALGFEHKLRSGEVCEILTAKEGGRPKVDWLKFVVTRLARHEINKALNRRR